MKYSKYLLIAASVVFLGSCTKLEEKFNSESTQGSGGGGGGGNAASLLNGAYRSLNNPFQDQSRWWAASEHSSDEAVGPTRGGDWDDNGVWRVYHNHKWTPDHGFLTDTYRELLQAQFAATTVLDASPNADQAGQAKFIRALTMWAVLDGWDQVPFRSTSLGDLTSTLPEVKKGSACADYLISELEPIAGSSSALPAGPGIGRASRDAAAALLMKIYLNRGVYANRAAPTFAAADMNKVIQYADQILANSAYSLTTNFFDNFAPNNDVIGKEIVYSLRNDNASGTGGNGVMFHYHCGTHYNQTPSGWNGFTTLGDFYDAFNANDKRRGGGNTGPTDFGYYPGFTNVTGMRVGMLFGQQKNGAGANLMDRKGNLLSFTKNVQLKETGNNLEITGVRVVKYVPDQANQFPANNDMVIFRLADVILMKAEAILRGGTPTSAGPYGNTALALVNYLRTHVSRGLTGLGTVTLADVYKERGFELYWEGWRRNDMIRFGTFLNARQLKGATTSERLLYPIPNQQLTINPNLVQNPGY